MDTELSGSFLKKDLGVSFTVGKTVGKLKTVVDLDTFHADTSVGVPFYLPFQEVGGRISGLLRISSQEAEPGELVYCGVPEQVQL